MVSASILEGGDGGWAGGLRGAGGLGGHALLQTGATAVLTLQGNLPHVGIGGLGGDGTPAADGELLSVLAGRVTDHGGPPRRLAVDSPLVVGDTLAFSLEGAPGDVMTLWVALLPGHTAVPGAAGVFLLEHALSVSPLPLGPVPPTGDAAEASWPVPPLGPGLPSVTLHVQQVALTPAGAALGSASVLTLLAEPVR
jgi:hypothetical protein